MSKEVSGDLEAMASLLDSRSGTPVSSNRNTINHIALFRPPFTNAPELTRMLTESKYLGKEKVTFRILDVGWLESELKPRWITLALL